MADEVGVPIDLVRALLVDIVGEDLPLRIEVLRPSGNGAENPIERPRISIGVWIEDDPDPNARPTWSASVPYAVR